MKTLTEYFFEANQYVVYYDSLKYVIDKNTITPWLEQLTTKSYFSPAFGVANNDITLKELQKGLWFEMEFNNTCFFAEMPFNKLLINVKPDFYGFNLIRFHENGYDGRCLFLNTHNSSTKFYNNLLNFAIEQSNSN